MTETSAAAGSAMPEPPAPGPPVAASAGAGAWQDTVADRRGQPYLWWTLLITGAFGVAFGAAVLVWPDVSLRIMAALAGVWLLVTGLARILGSFLPDGTGVVRHLLSGIVGIVILIAGMICLRDLASRLAVLALIFAVTWILSGVAGVIVAFQYAGATRFALLVAGVLALIAGVVLLATPSLSLTTLVVLTGVGSLVVGAGEVVVAFVVRRARGRLSEQH